MAGGVEAEVKGGWVIYERYDELLTCIQIKENIARKSMVSRIGI